MTGRLIVAYCITWALVHWFAYPNLDPYNDMLENFAWAQTFEWGTFKHPPVFVWVVQGWFAVMPHNALAYKLLSYLNVAVGLWGVAQLARQLGLGRYAPAAVLLLMWTLPYTTLAAKFNANAILLSVWPWTAVAWLASLRQTGRPGLVASLWLGGLGALCLLSKYYSGVFLLALFLAALLRRDGLQWFRSPRPYLALLTLFVGLLPHAWWLWHNDFPTLRYAMDQGAGHMDWRAILHFAITPLTFGLVAWISVVLVFTWQATGAVPGRSGLQRLGSGLVQWPRLALLSWRPQSWDDTLFWLAMLPGGLTLLAGLGELAELSSPWAIPTIFALPLLWLRNLSLATAPRAVRPAPADADARLAPVTARSLGALESAAWPVLVGVVLVGLALTVEQAYKGRRSYYEANEPAAELMAADWQRRHPDVPLGWTGGEWAENAMIAFFVSDRVRALPGMPNEWPTTLAPHPNWVNEGGLLICPRGPVKGPQLYEASNCEVDAQEWLERAGLPIQPRWVTAARSGWRFPQPMEFAWVVYDVLPGAATTQLSSLSPRGKRIKG
ncbi:glycosyltransferase family 39 protein [Curvibacter sp. RS43]|uniref:glycosyltransferase family 39 protein n=1 Tax=Curvibacter microcysteis TaxID=3026419 RepID=UPI00236103D6|nr:glycosyltransferase family 39 protein [Curvibacter sp. RS43]MDD0810306.1 glycosyltransferase family 39 protein [Curvibacter sp. RS43]